MTREQVETEMAQYRTIFTVVRLLDAAQVGGEESVNSFCSCYSYWGKNTPCRNCISRQVLEDHRQRTKLEYMGSEVFQVTAVYREVDGAPCVMELVQKLDGETLIDPENGDRLIDSITSYHTKLYHDALTDSYNRLYFEDALKDKTDPAGVAVLDLDDFKLINDTYGHQAGDMALRTCVDVVRACIRKSDVLIRYGGDEFLLVLPGIERAAFLAKLDRIREQLHTASVPGYSRLQLSSSIGGVITQPGETVEQAVSRADKLMYQAKNRKNMVVTEDNARDGALSAAGARKPFPPEHFNCGRLRDEPRHSGGDPGQRLQHSGGDERQRVPGHAGAVRHRHCADPAGHRHAGHGRLCGAERDEPQPLD